MFWTSPVWRWIGRAREIRSLWWLCDGWNNKGKKQASIQFAEFSSRPTWIPVCGLSTWKIQMICKQRSVSPPTRRWKRNCEAACPMFSDRSFFQICSAVTLRFISCEGLVQFTRIPERYTWHARMIKLMLTQPYLCTSPSFHATLLYQLESVRNVEAQRADPAVS